MKDILSRHSSKKRLSELINDTFYKDSVQNKVKNIKKPAEEGPANGYIANLIYKAELTISPLLILASSIIIFVLAFFILKFVMKIPALLVCIAVPAALSYYPLHYIKSKAQDKTNQFLEDFPSTLMATASNIKAGMTIINALERSTALLKEESPVKKEVHALVERLNNKQSLESAMKNFAIKYDVPETELFKKAFILASKHGGTFSAALERLAIVCNDRLTLMKQAKVSSITMRMTANILICVALISTLMMSSRFNDYWDTIFNDETSYWMAFSGTAIIITSYAYLKKISNFKP